jgi:hypothetical protein
MTTPTGIPATANTSAPTTPHDYTPTSTEWTEFARSQELGEGSIPSVHVHHEFPYHRGIQSSAAAVYQQLAKQNLAS